MWYFYMGRRYYSVNQRQKAPVNFYHFGAILRYIKKGLAEFDDVFHNTIGCLLGYGIYIGLLLLTRKHLLKATDRINIYDNNKRKTG